MIIKKMRGLFKWLKGKSAERESNFFRGCKGQVSLYITFFLVAVTIIVIAGVMAPLGTLFNARMIEAGEDILLRANDSIANINDASVRSAVQNSTDAALAAGVNNIEVNNALFQYSWIIIIVLCGLITFLFTRRLIEYGGAGFV